MKSEKGITLMSVIVYVVSMVIVIAIISVITTYFYNNIGKIGENIDPSKEYTKFASFFTEEVNKKGNKVLDCNTSNKDSNYIVFTSGNQYTFQDNKVYQNKVKIAEGIKSMSFSYQITNNKEVVIVKYKLQDNVSEKTATFTLVQ